MGREDCDKIINSLEAIEKEGIKIVIDNYTGAKNQVNDTLYAVFEEDGIYVPLFFNHEIVYVRINGKLG